MADRLGKKRVKTGYSAFGTTDSMGVIQFNSLPATTGNTTFQLVEISLIGYPLTSGVPTSKFYTIELSPNATSYTNQGGNVLLVPTNATGTQSFVIPETYIETNVLDRSGGNLRLKVRDSAGTVVETLDVVVTMLVY